MPLKTLSKQSFSPALGRKKVTYDDVLEELQFYGVIDLNSIENLDDVERQLRGQKKITPQFIDEIKMTRGVEIIVAQVAGKITPEKAAFEAHRREMLQGINPKSKAYRSKVMSYVRRKQKVYFYQKRLPYVVRKDKRGNYFAFNILNGKRLEKRVYQKHLPKKARE
jgi:hypothetical protein